MVRIKCAGFNTFWGLARPPTSYGAYAGDNKDAAKCATLPDSYTLYMMPTQHAHTSETLCVPPTVLVLSCTCACRYAYDYPAGWKVETIGKVRQPCLRPCQSDMHLLAS